MRSVKVCFETWPDGLTQALPFAVTTLVVASMAEMGCGGAQPEVVESGPTIEGAVAEPLVVLSKPPVLEADTVPRVYGQRYGNPSRNSRLPIALPSGTWVQVWSKEIPRDADLVVELEAHEDSRIRVGNVVFDSAGKLVATERDDSVAEAVDTALRQAVFEAYGENPCGGPGPDQRLGIVDVWAKQGPPGAPSRRSKPGKNEPVYCSGFNHVTTSGDSDVFVVHSALESFVPGSGPRRCGVIESFDRKSMTLRGHAATGGRTAVGVRAGSIYLTLGRYLYRTDASLRATKTVDLGRALDEVRSMSFDDAGNLYLDADDSVWVLTPQLEQIARLRHRLSWARFPPVVGYDHTIYLGNNDGIMALDTAGKRLWSDGSTGDVERRTGSAAVTLDGQLLAAQGRQLAAYDGGGRRTVLFEFPGQIVSPPLLTRDQRLYVIAGFDNTKLYALRVEALEETTPNEAEQDAPETVR